jgi:DNA-binding XRE family transcriptional regulator
MSSTSVTGICYTQVTFDMAAPAPTHTTHGVSIAAIVAEREKDSRKAAAYARARQKLAARLTDGAPSLAQLRLAKGMSQAQLATAMGAKQPYVARLEKGSNDIQVSTIEALAKALSVPASDVFAAVFASRQKQEGQT